VGEVTVMPWEGSRRPEADDGGRNRRRCVVEPRWGIDEGDAYVGSRNDSFAVEVQGVEAELQA
jgi:hypothetical protein